MTFILYGKRTLPLIFVKRFFHYGQNDDALCLTTNRHFAPKTIK